MADDPRIDAEFVVEEIDKADPLRALLADEDRALAWLHEVLVAHAESVRHAIAAKVAPPRTTAQAVLAALREVAGGCRVGLWRSCWG